MLRGLIAVEGDDTATEFVLPVEAMQPYQSVRILATGDFSGGVLRTAPFLVPDLDLDLDLKHRLCQVAAVRVLDDFSDCRIKVR